MTTLLIIIFILGYTAIAAEHFVRINKAASALVCGVLSWSVFALYSTDEHWVNGQLGHHMSELAGILFFLLSAMTIVELIDAHDGFDLITRRIRTRNKKSLVWLVAFITFFLSALLDNLTTTIVLISLLRKIIPDRNDRFRFTGLVIIAANAGGAWSPLGDITTTMLWLGGQVTPLNIVLKTFLPCLASMLLPAWLISRQVKGGGVNTENNTDDFTATHSRASKIVCWVGLGCLLFVPIFKTITHLPPYMGILLGLGLMWSITELIHRGKDEAEKGLLSVNHALRKIDTPSVLFFLGILLSIAALSEAGLLSGLARWMQDTIRDIKLITILIGLLSAIIDNVPLVAAAQSMYGLEQYPTDHYFWEFLSYCAGTGGSCLVIGSAAGVAAMGLEKIDFLRYLKKIGWLALLGYFMGILVFLLQDYLRTL